MRYVYLITNLETKKVYVGQTKNPVLRKAQHLSAARKGKDSFLSRALRKYCRDDVLMDVFHEKFSFEVIEECDDNLINEREQFWVSHYDSFNNEKGYNLTSGGLQNTNISEETRKKIGDSSRERMKDPKYRNAIGDRYRGRKQDPEHTRKRVETFLKTGCRKGIEAWNKGIVGQESWNKGISWSDDIKSKISQALKGRPSPNKGKKFGTGKCSFCSEQGHRKNKCPKKVDVSS